MTALNVSGLLSGSSWGSIGQPVAITYSFLTSVPSYYGLPGSTGYPTGFASLTPIQQSVVLAGLQEWANVAKITFVPVTQSGNTVGQMTFGRRDLGEGIAATGAYPGQASQAGDVWLATNFSDPTAGDFYYSTILHEIGHALGLKHPIPYAGEPGGSNPPPYYTGQYLGQANELYTLMAYDPNPYNSNWHATGPMLYDIEAIQALYGKNTTYRSGNDVYEFTPGTISYRAIWDGGGTDEISAVLFSTSVVIDLREGDYFTAIGPTNLTQFNIGIARGAEIENATGGSGNDSLFGNDLANYLKGGAGNDLLDGGRSLAAVQPGSTGPGVGDGATDTLEGGIGNDTYILRVGGGTIDTIMDDGPTDTLRFYDKQNGLLPFEPVALVQPGGSSWLSPTNNRWKFELSGGDLIVTDTTTNAQGKLLNWQDGDFGIRKIDPRPNPAAPIRTFHGDKEDHDSNAAEDGIQTVPDGIGNIKRADGQEGRPDIVKADREDVFYGSTAADEVELFQLGGGNDKAYADGSQPFPTTGGIAWMQGGAGRDQLYAGVAKDLLEGGEDGVFEGDVGGDTLYGDVSDDELYADSKIDLKDAITAGNTGIATGLKGDVLSGGEGADWLVGAAANDFLLGGSGRDVIIAGAGDDNIYGDSSGLADVEQLDDYLDGGDGDRRSCSRISRVKAALATRCPQHVCMRRVRSCCRLASGWRTIAGFIWRYPGRTPLPQRAREYWV